MEDVTTLCVSWFLSVLLGLVSRGCDFVKFGIAENLEIVGKL
ncbi:uncharacterized protein Bfra_008265 [Botrytis fragariae]|uniref:Uncharacterized protein n=1 Tax=Botrytis fragariae TaxID=1964551 RepID=A0A8H6EI17_9HELO|nr:uncharacterized protein Bfra_008265 [Botrytis fragariae]KAF5872988.1 hypothetical protein Bfra_008265 [Botrytis fragariae]